MADFTFSLDPDENFASGINERDKYESSLDYEKDIQTENFREEFAPVADKETAKVADDDDSGVVGNVLNFGKHVAIGAAKGVEEVGQTFRLLDDNAFNLPLPQTTAEGLAQGFGQFLPAFIPAAGAIGAGVRAAGLVGKTRKAKMAVDFLIGTSAGVVADAAAFDPKDPNVANFLLTTGAIAQDSSAGLAVKALLAQDDSDSEALARTKSAATGAIAGAILTGLFRGAGYAVSKVKGEITHLDGIPIKEVQDLAAQEADTFVDGVLKSKGVDDGAVPKVEPTYKISSEGFKQLGNDTPSIEAAIKDQAERAADDYVRPWDQLSPEKQKEAGEIVSRWAETGKVDSVDLKTIESMNFLKLKTPQDIRNVLQFLAEKMDIKKLLKGRIKTEHFDTVEGAAELLELPQAEMSRIISEQAGNVRGAIKFVGAARAISAAAMKKAEDAFELYANGGKDSLYEEGLTNTKLAYDMLAAGGELSKASSDLLRSHQKFIDPVTELSNIKTALRHSVLYNDPELSIKQAGWFATARNVDTLKVEAQFPGGAKQTRRIPKIKGETPAQTEKRAIQEARRGELGDINRANRKLATSRAKAMDKSFKARGRDAMLEIYINGLLSSAKTFEINMLGNSTAIITSVIDRAYAGFVKRGGEVTGKEAAILAKSYWNSITSLSDMWALMKQAWRLEPTGAIKQDFIRPHDRTLSAAGMKVGGNLGHMINVFGSVVNFPGKILLAADEVFKTINYRAETRALAYRKAFREMGSEASSVEQKVNIKNRFAEIMKDLEAHDDIIEEAKGFSAKNTFTNPLASHVIKGVDGAPDKVVPGMGLRLKGILDSDPTGIMRVFLPFFQTPANLLNFAWERTPLLRKLNKGLQADLAPDAPKAVRELAEAKVATSRMLWASTIGLAMSGEFTGGPPVDHRLRKTLEADMGGSHWYSYRWNGKWHKYDRFDPIGVIMGASAHAVVMGKASMNLAGQYEKGDPSDEIHEKYMEVLEAGTVGMVRLITDRHYLQSFSEMINLFSGDGSLLGKVQKAGEKVGLVYNPLTAMSSGFYSSLRRNITGGLEPEKLDKLQRTELKDFQDVAKEIGIVFEDATRRVTPGYGEKRAAKNLAGETTLFPGTNYEMDRQPFQVLRNLATSVFDPNPGLTPSSSALIHKLAELESTIAQPSSVKTLGGVLLTDEEKGFFVDSWTDMNKRLNRMAGSKGFNKFPEGMQRDILETMIAKNKQAAQEFAMAKFPRLLQGAFDLKINSLQSKALKEVPTGFNFANIRGQ
jgi:hypothetical protein